MAIYDEMRTDVQELVKLVGSMSSMLLRSLTGVSRPIRRPAEPTSSGQHGLMTCRANTASSESSQTQRRIDNGSDAFSLLGICVCLQHRC